MKVIPSAPLLPSSPHTLGKEQETPFGTFQIEWEAGIDHHVLLFLPIGGEYGPRVLCSHNNGCCMQEVIERVKKGDVSRILSQVKYIRDCGGMSVNDSAIEFYFSPNTKAD